MKSYELLNIEIIKVISGGKIEKSRNCSRSHDPSDTKINDEYLTEGSSFKSII